MTSQNNKELKNVSKKIFAPPVAQPRHVPLAKRKPDELPGEQKDVEAKGISALQSHAAGDGRATKPMKAAKIPKRQKEGTSTRKNLGTTKENEGCLTDAQFEEIFQSVLQKPLQELIENSEKKAFSAEPTKERGLRRETLETSLTTKNDTSRNESEEKSEAMLLEVEKKVHQFTVKQHSRLSESKSRKGKNEKPEADNGGCKENRKGAPKKKVQGNAPVVIDQEEMQEEEEKADRGSGWCIAWVQCSYPNCEKWRRLSSDIDPSVLPEDWSCSQNPDLQYNSCSIPEEAWSGSEDEVVYAVYIPGSLVWAKQYGYPWWPGIIEADPDIGEYLLFSSQMDSLPSKYHVTFFGNCMTRAWISASMLRNFGESNMERNGLGKLRSKSEKKNLETALKMAKEAEQINIQERIRMFGFHSQFSERTASNNLQDCVSIMGKSRAKKVQGPGGEKKNQAMPKKSQEKLLYETSLVKPDVNVKKKIKTTGDKKVNLTAEELPPLSKKGRKEEPFPKATAVAEGSGKARGQQKEQKGFKKSFSVPQPKNNKDEHLSPAHLALSSYPSKKDSLDKANSKDSGGLEEPSEPVAFDQDEEETFSSQEMAVFAVERNDSPEDFSLVLFEE